MKHGPAAFPVKQRTTADPSSGRLRWCQEHLVSPTFFSPAELGLSKVFSGFFNKAHKTSPRTHRPCPGFHATHRDATPAALLGNLGKHHVFHPGMPACFCCRMAWPHASSQRPAAPFPPAVSRRLVALILFSAKGRCVQNRGRGESGACMPVYDFDDGQHYGSCL